MKARVRQVYKYSWWCEYTPKSLGMFADNLAKCSCTMCGNPRRHFGERSVQEQRQDQVDRE